MARTLRNHFMTINGAFVSDTLVNHAIRVLRHDKDTDVINLVTEIQAFQDFDDSSSQASSASANTEMSVEQFGEILSKSRRSSHSTDGETSQMEEEIIKASGIAIIRAAEKKLAEQAKFKPEVVKLSNLNEIKKRENFDSGSEGEFSSQISQEEED